MKQVLKSLFSENSEISMIRVMTFIVTCTACFLAISGKESVIGIVGVLLGTAFTGKVAQKSLEK